MNAGIAEATVLAVGEAVEEVQGADAAEVLRPF